LYDKSNYESTGNRKRSKGCEIIGRWRKSFVRHFYWAVTSTKDHLGELKLPKFEAFLSHVINIHGDPPNRIFNACAHGHITTPRVWMTKCMTNVLFPWFITPNYYEVMSFLLTHFS